MYKDHFKDGAQTTDTAYHVWHISFNGCISGLEEVCSIAAKTNKYDLASYNCADVAVSVGRACGAPIPDAGLPDLSIIEIVRGWFDEDENWDNAKDGSYSSPFGLMLNLKYINWMYGVVE